MSISSNECGTAKIINWCSASDVGELYDVKNDPAEMHNLFYKSEYQAVKKEMLEEMHAEMVRLKDPLENWVYRIINEI
ncbi:Uncharacterised protein [Haemophilus paraphrohaemolyticus]|nr:Uncharacterised protein [Haemophilus paraphrohaemolyticus]